MRQNTAYFVSYTENPTDYPIRCKNGYNNNYGRYNALFPITVLPRSAGATLFVPPPIYCYSILSNRTTKLKTITRFGSDIWLV